MVAQPLFAESTHHSSAQNYTFGIVPQYNASQIVSIWRPILDLLEKETGLHFSLVGSDNIPAFEKEFSAGKFDFVYMNPYHFMRAERSQGYRPLVRDVENKLFGIIVVHKDSLIKRVEELDNKLVAFPAPNALGASLMVRADLDNIYHIKIRPRYVQSHSSVYLNVALGKADAGGGVQKTLARQPPELRDQLRVLYRTREEVVPHPIAVHPRVSPSVQEQVKNTLLMLNSTLTGRQLLSKIPIHKIGIALTEEYFPLQELGLEPYYQED